MRLLVRLFTGIDVVDGDGKMDAWRAGQNSERALRVRMAHNAASVFVLLCQ